MSKPFEAVDRETLGREVWDAMVQLYICWANAARLGNRDAAARAEREIRSLVLAYASLMPDDAAVTTGRKAILRSQYAELGAADTAHVAAMLSCVIAREEAAAHRCAGHREHG